MPTTLRLPRTMRLALFAGLAVVLGLAIAFAVDALRAGLAGDDLVVRYAAAVDPRTPGERSIAITQARLGTRPNDYQAMVQLGTAYLLRGRETADPSYTTRASEAFARAAAVAPNDPEVLVGQATLLLSNHQFAEALELGQRTVRQRPQWAPGWGVLVDSFVELGRYEQAYAAADRMIAIRPDIASYSRISYLRELQGDLPGAIEAMGYAAGVASTAGEHAAWTRVLLGHLYLQTGDLAAAERSYRQAQAEAPRDVLPLVGYGKLAIARGDLAGAIGWYETVVERLPMPEYVVALGELYTAAGRTDDAARQWALVRTLLVLNAAAGQNADLAFALFEAEWGDPATALRLAEAEVARRESVHAWDALGWARLKLGDVTGARDAATRALRLGSADSRLLYHAGMAAAAAGDAEGTRKLLGRALADPAFSPLHAIEARAALARLG